MARRKKKGGCTICVGEAGTPDGGMETDSADRESAKTADAESVDGPIGDPVTQVGGPATSEAEVDSLVRARFGGGVQNANSQARSSGGSLRRVELNHLQDAGPSTALECCPLALKPGPHVLCGSIAG